MRVFEKYGPVVNMSLMGTEVVGTNHPAVAELFAKESEYFTKKIGLNLKEIKAFGGQGLFTTDTDDDDWKLAHKLLMPAFSPRAIKVKEEEGEEEGTCMSHLYILGLSTRDGSDCQTNDQNT